MLLRLKPDSVSILFRWLHRGIKRNVIVLVAPKIKTPLNDIRIKAGLIFHLDVDFVGEPVPEVIWTVGSRPLTADERTTVTSIGYHTIIHTVNVKRSDSGQYHLLLRNSSGIDEGSFQLIVLGISAILNAMVCIINKLLFYLKTVLEHRKVLLNTRRLPHKA